ncbi:hypothetical protein [Rhodococcus sp. NBC_00294]|uniref:hypothetical protein n=1 Tax=Rhodococcus sp. NBC_00294 TaxID=2976004 RepID=UPI002E2E5264|nr:hypothetical protein [Rhodococcus sp. NBC_00294]
MKLARTLVIAVAVGSCATVGTGSAAATEVTDPVQGFAESWEFAVDECSSGMLSGALSGASVGGMLGAAGGPLGVAVGAAVGGFVGEVGGGETSCEERVISGRAVPEPASGTKGHKGSGRR